MSLMCSIAMYACNSVLNYNLNYNSLLCLGYCKPGLLLQKFSELLYRDLLGTL